jgi:hypothetical protein
MEGYEEGYNRKKNWKNRIVKRIENDGTALLGTFLDSIFFTSYIAACAHLPGPINDPNIAPLFLYACGDTLRRLYTLFFYGEPEGFTERYIRRLIAKIIQKHK